jgi:hypothetical protein
MWFKIPVTVVQITRLRQGAGYGNKPWRALDPLHTVKPFRCVFQYLGVEFLNEFHYVGKVDPKIIDTVESC